MTLRRWQKNISRSLLFGIIALALLLPVVAGAAEEKITLHYLTWATGVGVPWIQEDLIEPFQKLHPNIVIKHEAVSFGQFLDKLMVYTATGDAPDLMHVSAGWVYELAQKGMLRDLQPWFNRDLKPNELIMEVTNATRYPSSSGDLYALPFAVMMMGFFYNKDMFDTAGVTYPGNNTTWYDVRDIAKKLAADTNGDGVKDRWGIFSDYGYQDLDPMIHAFGGQILDQNFKVRMNEEPALNAAKFLTDLIFKDQVAPIHQSGLASRGALFQQGKLGMLVTSSPLVSDFRANANFDWDLAMMPKGPAKRVVRAWPDSFGISATAKHPEAAWEYIKFVVQQRKMDRYTGDRKLPIYLPLATSKDWLQVDQKPNKRVFIDQIPYTDPLEWRPRWFDWDAARNKALAPAWQGKTPVETAMLQAAEAIQRIVSEPAK